MPYFAVIVPQSCQYPSSGPAHRHKILCVAGQQSIAGVSPGRALLPGALGPTMPRVEILSLRQKHPVVRLEGPYTVANLTQPDTRQERCSPMTHILDDTALDLLFREARTERHWQDKPVSDALLNAVWDLARMPPTAANCSPMRVVFVRSPEAKARLRPALAPNNVPQTMAAPVTAIFAHDTAFYERLGYLYPAVDARAWYIGNPPLIAETAFRNGTLQAAYFILAARGLGLACGPMSGFNAEMVNAAFFPDTTVQANFLCNLGFGSGENLYPRGPRLSFAETCQVV